MKRILTLGFSLALTAVLFQNCSMPNQNSLGSGSSSSESEATSASSTPGALSLRSVNSEIYTNQKIQLIASGGVGPYQYTVLDGDGTVDQSNGSFTAGDTGGSVVVQLMDSHSQSVTLTLNVLSYVWKESDYILYPIHMGTKSDSRFYAFTKDEVKTKGYSHNGVLFNTFREAVVMQPVYLCFTEKIKDYFPSPDPACEGIGVKVNFFGYLEKKATSIVKTPVFRCKKKSGNAMHIVTLDKEKDCTSAKGYVFEAAIGFTK